DPSGQIGETGQVFVGVYTAQITDTQRTDQGKYLRDVRPGQPFAAKYAQLATDTEPYDYLCHVVEKAVMKALSHPNIMAYRVVINLGQRAILRNISGTEAPDHAGYRRVFLIMDYADHGTLFKFVQKGKLYDRLAVQFTGELCSAMGYMHAKGVAHNDLHHKNILVFNARGGEYIIKLTDFGMSISRALYGKLGVEVSADDIQEMIENDLSELKGMLNFMIGKCNGNALNEGVDLTRVSQLSNELSRTREPLLDVLKRYIREYTSGQSAPIPTHPNTSIGMSTSPGAGELNVSSNEWPGGLVGRLLSHVTVGSTVVKTHTDTDLQDMARRYGNQPQESPQYALSNIMHTTPIPTPRFAPATGRARYGRTMANLVDQMASQERLITPATGQSVARVGGIPQYSYPTPPITPAAGGRRPPTPPPKPLRGRPTSPPKSLRGTQRLAEPYREPTPELAPGDEELALKGAVGGVPTVGHYYGPSGAEYTYPTPSITRVAGGRRTPPPKPPRGPPTPPPKMPRGLPTPPPKPPRSGTVKVVPAVGQDYVPTGATPIMRESQKPWPQLRGRYEFAPNGYQTGRTGDTTSGELNVSSAEWPAFGLGRYASYVTAHKPVARLRAKTKRDLQKLRGKGFDIGQSIGQGAFGEVFTGGYTDQIEVTKRTEQGRRLSDVKSGDRFAAKYVQFPKDRAASDHLNHFIEKCILKSLQHENIVTYRVAINLGRKVILCSVSGDPSHDIVSYRRAFLVMDCADQGTLKDFGDAGRLTDQVTVKFIRELCTAMAYMHGKGVSHGDVHFKNILVFSTSGGGYTAKWTDFGLSVSRDVFARWGHELTPRVLYKWAKADANFLQSMVTYYMLATCANNPGNVGTDMSEVKAFDNELEHSKELLTQIMPKYEMFQ
ncbi:unnamed protein product, partial [Medioppia subpectinata]